MKKWKGIISKLFVIASLIAMLTGCNTIVDATSQPAPAASQGKMTVKYIDVGQGDSTLIVSPKGVSPHRYQANKIKYPLK